MDLDNIIYIVATIVIFVVSLLGQKKKKVQAPLPEQEEEGVYTLNDFEKILERKQEYQQPEHVIEEVNGENDDEEIIEPISKTSKVKDKHTDNIIDDDENENQDGFDVKSAVIYSSILERKKFRH